jgi:NAD(P)-dependent dehydrogenase (short-subunit alcohol dehydrogenase family)
VVKFANDKPLDRLVCNAAVYQPSLDHAKWSKDGIEQQIQSNFLSHFLMISKLMPHMAGAKGWTRGPPSVHTHALVGFVHLRRALRQRSLP